MKTKILTAAAILFISISINAQNLSIPFLGAMMDQTDQEAFNILKFCDERWEMSKSSDGTTCYVLGWQVVIKKEKEKVYINTYNKPLYDEALLWITMRGLDFIKKEGDGQRYITKYYDMPEDNLIVAHSVSITQGMLVYKYSIQTKSSYLAMQ